MENIYTYSTIEASKMTGIGLRTIQRKCAAKKIGRKIGRDYRLTEKDIKTLKTSKGNP